MRISTTGLIIKQQNIGEQDKLVTVLTKDMGVVRAFVRGAKNIKNPKSAATDLLCYSRINLYFGKEKYIIDEASVEEMFFSLRKDIVKVSLAQYFCELALHICPSGQEASKQLSLILNALHLLSNSDRDPEIIKACTELRLACLAGYMPDLIMCRGCGVYESECMYFSLSDGSLKCSECIQKKPVQNAVEIDPGVLMSLRHICFCEDKKVFAFSLSQEGLAKLSYITETYVSRVLEKDFSTLHFYRTIKT